MLELRALCAGYHDRPVLRDVDLVFRPGKVLALLGPNGCGKSTLLRTAAGLLPSQGGTVLLDGVPLTSCPPRLIAQKAAYLPQSRTVPAITAERMVLHGRFPYLSYPRRYSAADRALARQALEWVDAGDLTDRLLPELSGGQRQKVYLAMALAQDTETVLMDEPTTYLDVRHQLEVMALARRLAAQGKAVVLVLHDLCLALQTADELAVLAKGRLQQTGTPEEIFESGILDRVMDVELRRLMTDNGWRYYPDLPEKE